MARGDNRIKTACDCDQEPCVCEFEVQGWYGEEYGWEKVTTEVGRPAAVAQLACYRENEPQYSHRMVRVS